MEEGGLRNHYNRPVRTRFFGTAVITVVIVRVVRWKRTGILRAAAQSAVQQVAGRRERTVAVTVEPGPAEAEADDAHRHDEEDDDDASRGQRAPAIEARYPAESKEDHEDRGDHVPEDGVIGVEHF